jgi:hypothetical protein
VFRRSVDGVALRFHLAGINNQNFLMRDEQTGTYWQQITGLGVAGPLAGRRLELVPADELTFALWKKEQPQGSVLADMVRFASHYAKPDWDTRMAKQPTVLNYSQAGLHPRDLMIGVKAFGASRAFPYSAVLRERLILDRVGTGSIMLVLGPDNRSVRVFDRHLPGVTKEAQFYRLGGDNGFLIDAETGSGWDFEGCAGSGKMKGKCLTQIDALKDYWFDWRHYNAGTTVYGVSRRIR